MDYIDLDRHFAPLKKGEEPTLDYTPHWGRRVGGWLNWEQLVQHRRVALLAEALSGKTWELEHRVKVLRAEQKPAFFVRIEDLADGGFETALDAEDVTAFRGWKDGSVKDAWFFLDSVDEARLNHKSFPNALRAFRNELGLANLNRSYVFVSCRVSDWKGIADVQAIQNGLPFKEPSPADRSTVSAEDELLAPIFQNDRGHSAARKKEPPAEPSDLLVVQLVPLSAEQKIKMAVASGTDGQVFMEAVRQSGLDSMSERPGDLLELLDYWGEHGRFATLREMMASSIDRKLRELNPERGGAGLLSPEKAREGAQRLAGALTFVQTFSIKGPQQEPDPTLAKGALDASVVLGEWPADQMGALLRTGLFAPSTYGRIKFHHRGTQEYLAARWLNSLSEANLPNTDLRQLLFADRYGVPTAVPTLLPISAWLAQWNPRVRDDLAIREPVALIAHGDARSLPLQTKEKLLSTYATLDAKGELDAEQVSYRAAWMFSEPGLGPAIQKAWRANQRSEFRYQLLNFILEGKLTSCIDIAREASTARTGGSNMRLVATQALAACGDAKGLKGVADLLRTSPDLYGVRAAPGVIDVLYPSYLATRDVVQLIDRLRSDDKYSFESFGRHLAYLHGLAPSRTAKAEFIAGIAEIVTRGGLVDEHADTAPKRRSDLDEGLAQLILAELKSCGLASSDLISIIMALERAGHLVNGEEDHAAVAAAVRQDPALNREVMWANESVRRQSEGSAAPPIRCFSIGPFLGNKLWSLELEDAAWLAQDAKSMPEESQRRIAFHALWCIYQSDGQLDAQVSQLEMLAAREAVLQADLDSFMLRPPEEPNAANVARREASEKKTEADKQSWRDFRLELASEPTLLSRADHLTTWRAGLYRLWHITLWIHQKSRKDGFSGMHAWKAVAHAFGDEVLAHYLRGMSAAWRSIKPERPVITGPNSHTTKNVNTLAANAIELESLAEGNWPASLTPSDIEVAARHLLMTSNVRVRQFSQLAELRPDLVQPIVVDALRVELRSGGRLQDVLSFVGHNDVPFLLACTAEEVFRQLQKKDPDDKDTLDQCIAIVKRAASILPARTMKRLVQKRVEAHLRTEDQDRVFKYLSLLSVLDGEAFALFALGDLAQRSSEGDAEHTERVRTWLAAAFDYRASWGFAPAALNSMSVASLTDLVRLAYHRIHPSQDQNRNSASGRDRAEGARSALLDALLKRPGPQAHAAILQLAGEPDFAVSSMRFKELAHRKAQTDSDLTPWTAEEVREFGRRFSAPVKSGPQFMRVVQGILDEIADGLRVKDATSRALLEMADNEERVQEWLAERLEEKSRGRFSSHREVEVAEGNEPDITLTSHAAPVEVAIEIKHANMRWTVKKLEKALTEQLAQKYLLTEKRRHGLLVISLHKRRTWRVGTETWSFERVIEHLGSLARHTTSNRTGDVELAVVAINAAVS